MKTQILDTLYSIKKNATIDGIAQQPKVECTLICKAHYDRKEYENIILPSFQNEQVRNNIVARLRGHRNVINDVVYGRTFRITAETELRPGDVFDENIGRHIAETKARTKLFKINAVFTEEMTKHFVNIYEHIVNLNSRNQYLLDRERAHLVNDILPNIVEKQ